jgi:hypothetical protein
MPHAWGIYAKAAADIIGLEVIGIALVVMVALAFYWIVGATWHTYWRLEERHGRQRDRWTMEFLKRLGFLP